MNKIFRCGWCKKEFSRDKRHRVYCSQECAQQARIHYRKKRLTRWRQRNRISYNEYMRQYMQEYRKEHKKGERLFLKAGTIYLKKTKDWNEELKLLEKFLKPIRSYR